MNDTWCIVGNAESQVKVSPQYSLQWRHNVRDSVSSHQPHGCLLNRLFKHRSKRTSKLRVTPRWPVNYPHTGPVTQKMSLFEDVIMLYRKSCNLPNHFHPYTLQLPHCHHTIMWLSQCWWSTHEIYEKISRTNPLRSNSVTIAQQNTIKAWAYYWCYVVIVLIFLVLNQNNLEEQGWYYGCVCPARSRRQYISNH